MTKSRNRLIPILAFFVVAIAVWFIYSAFSKHSEVRLVDAQPVGSPPLVSEAPIDQDVPRTEMIKLMSDMQDMTEVVDNLHSVITVLQAENAQQAAALEGLKEIGKDVVIDRVSTGQITPPSSLIRSPSSSRPEPVDVQEPSSAPAPIELPPAIRSLTDSASGFVSPPPTRRQAGQMNVDPQGIVWLKPMDADAAGLFADVDLLSLKESGSQTALDAYGQGVQLAQNVESDITGRDRAQVEPRFTIPHGSVIADSRSVTALVGKIPVRGQLQDPWRFRISTGSNIVLPNNQTLPGLERTIAEGTAIGDLNLSCVTGRIDVVTFVFSDGRIVTQRAQNQRDGLGYITDHNANPCIPGSLITNAPQSIAKLSALGAFEAFAGATADAETQTSVGLDGTASSIVTGDRLRNASFNAASGAASEVRQWFADRMGQYFDVIYVPAGQRVDILISEAIRLDYDPEGRKVRYEVDTHGTGYMD
ncbi:MAG: TIGR03752 family integrating conjugative element protein [Methyloprofundus sp.]|nr:TIGR03752 family integrating conjugative element protein [Methyloprofundus sp.]